MVAFMICRKDVNGFPTPTRSKSPDSSNRVSTEPGTIHSLRALIRKGPAGESPPHRGSLNYDSGQVLARPPAIRVDIEQEQLTAPGAARREPQGR